MTFKAEQECVDNMDKSLIKVYEQSYMHLTKVEITHPNVHGSLLVQDYSWI